MAKNKPTWSRQIGGIITLIVLALSLSWINNIDGPFFNWPDWLGWVLAGVAWLYFLAGDFLDLITKPRNKKL